MAKRQPIPIEFKFPLSDPMRMARIVHNGKLLITEPYQNAYDSLPDDQKEIGFEILNKKFKEEYGQDKSLRLLDEPREIWY